MLRGQVEAPRARLLRGLLCARHVRRGDYRRRLLQSPSIPATAGGDRFKADQAAPQSPLRLSAATAGIDIEVIST